MLQAYIAAPLFTEAERLFNLGLCDALSGVLYCYLPQRDGILLTEAVRAGSNRKESSESIFSADIAAIRAADLIIAVLDGPDSDAGVAVEVGVAWAIGKRVVGLRTDSRHPISGGLNPMIEGACFEIATDTEQLLALVREASESAI